MKISTRVEGDTAILELEGSLVAGGADESLIKAAREVLDAGVRTVVLDVRGVPFVDSAGLGAMVQCSKDCESAASSVCLRGVPNQLRGLLEIARLTEMLPIENDG